MVVKMPTEYTKEAITKSVARSIAKTLLRNNEGEKRVALGDMWRKLLESFDGDLTRGSRRAITTALLGEGYLKREKNHYVINVRAHKKASAQSLEMDDDLELPVRQSNSFDAASEAKNQDVFDISSVEKLIGHITTGDLSKDFNAVRMSQVALDSYNTEIAQEIIIKCKQERKRLKRIIRQLNNFIESTDYNDSNLEALLGYAEEFIQ